jgi:N-acetylglucosamine-6-phosphate deacetylase
MRIRNANIYTEEHRFVRGDAAVENGRFVSYTGDPAGEEAVVDAKGMYLIPGLVDIHFHGCKGADMCDGTKEALDVITSYEASVGVTSVCPATMTIPKDELLEVMKNAGSYEYSGGSHLVGINMEGPFISPAKKGAQAAENIMHCDYEYFSQLQKAANGLIKLVDIAPEEKGAMEFIEQCHDQVKISIAHTCSDYDTAREALEKGVGHMTHLYNAMPGINHREPGPIIAALEAGAEVELIADGIHIHPAMVRTTFRIFGADKVILISDSMEATGLLDGDYQLGGQGVTVKGRKAVLTKDPGVIAGSVTNLFDCMKNCVLNMGIPLEDAVLAATENPAESIGVEKDYGKIAVGNYGNLLLLDKDLQIKNIVQKGKIMSV